MEEVLNEQIEATAQPAEAEKNLGEEKAEISLGKFKDVNALLQAYNSLQAEFTKRCQRLKELEGIAEKTNGYKIEKIQEIKGYSHDVIQKEFYIKE